MSLMALHAGFSRSQFSPRCPNHHCCWQVIAGQALQSTCLALHSSGGSGVASGSGSGACLRLTHWIFIFSASQLLLCLLPDINSLGAVTALGAATTVGFSVLATVGAALHGVHPLGAAPC